MKKFVCLVLAAMLILCSFAMAEKVFVTVSTGEGRLAMTNLAVEASDLDSDGVVSINDALIAAHDMAYEGGSEAGYASEETPYGISMTRLWGEENGGSYGYYLNDASPMSLLDAVSDGDSIHAYAFQDLAGWSDTYCYFQVKEAEMGAGDSVILTLTALLFDADWNIVPTPVEGAVITIDGSDTEFITNVEGCAAVSIADEGSYTISARHESMTLVPPVCVVEVK